MVPLEWTCKSTRFKTADRQTPLLMSPDMRFRRGTPDKNGVQKRCQ